jgi:hypothetical protein
MTMAAVAVRIITGASKNYTTVMATTAIALIITVSAFFC